MQQWLKWTDPRRITVPEGMIRVTRDKVKAGDLIYSDPEVTYADDAKFFKPIREGYIGTRVSNWWLIVRKVSSRTNAALAAFQQGKTIRRIHNANEILFRKTDGCFYVCGMGCDWTCAQALRDVVKNPQAWREKVYVKGINA